MKCIVEVLGPAGSGKTTVVRALRMRHLAAQDQLAVSWPEKLRFFSSITMQLLPSYLRECPGSRWLNREELRRMLYAKAWPNKLEQHAASGMITIVDHGPICMLGLVREFGPELVSSQCFARWSDAAITVLSAVLNIVLWLDAPDTTLVRRINLRENNHVLKGKPFREASVFLQRCRLSYEQILSALTVRGGLKVLRFDTSTVSTDDIIDQLLQAIGSLASGGQVRYEGDR